jgi:hypothetical protein
MFQKKWVLVLPNDCRPLADSVAKLPKRRGTEFPLNDKTSGNRDRCSVKRATEVGSEFVTE